MYGRTTLFTHPMRGGERAPSRTRYLVGERHPIDPDIRAPSEPRSTPVRLVVAASASSRGSTETARAGWQPEMEPGDRTGSRRSDEPQSKMAVTPFSSTSTFYLRRGRSWTRWRSSGTHSTSASRLLEHFVEPGFIRPGRWPQPDAASHASGRRAGFLGDIEECPRQEACGIAIGTPPAEAGRTGRLGGRHRAPRTATGSERARLRKDLRGPPGSWPKDAPVGAQRLPDRLDDARDRNGIPEHPAQAAFGGESVLLERRCALKRAMHGRPSTRNA